MVRDSGSTVCRLGMDAASANFGHVPRLSQFQLLELQQRHPPCFWEIQQDKVWAPKARLAHRAPSGTGRCQHSPPRGFGVTVALAHRSQLSGLARQGLKPPPVGKGPEHWASSHLTSASALYRPHTMGLGTTPAPPATPRLCTAGNQALPSTAARGSSSPGSALINQPERRARELRPWESAPKVASETHTPRGCCVPETETESRGCDFQSQLGCQASCLRELQ